jgi:uncharacterized protein (TIGR03067 family)
MWRLAFVSLALAVGLLLAADAPKDDKEQLQGRWVMVSLELDGEKVPEDQVATGRLVVEGNRYTPTYAGVDYPETFTLDPSVTPKEIDFTYTDGPRKGETVKGIYKLEGDQYVMCRALRSEDPRPKQFATESGSGLALVVWKRDTPAEAAKRAAIASDRKALDGTWVAVRGVRDGKPVAEEEVRRFRLTVIGDRYTVDRGDKFDRGTSQIDPTTHPKSIDITYVDGQFTGLTLLGIYEVEGDTHKACFAPAGKARPKEFRSEPGSGNALWELRRSTP